jgi:hypothetical protein
MAEKKKNSQLCSSKKNTDKMYIALVQIWIVVQYSTWI